MPRPFFVVLSLLLASACASLWYCGAPPPTWSPLPAGYTVIHASVVTRHGDRSPTQPMPNMAGVQWDCDTTDLMSFSPPLSDPTSSYTEQIFIDPQATFASVMWSGNCTAGQLTSRGAQQQLAMGAALRSIYVDSLGLLPANYTPGTLFARCDSEWRTRQSAMALLGGLYPAGARPAGLPSIPIITFPVPMETFSSNPTACPALALLPSPKTSPQWLAHEAALMPLYDKISSVLAAPNTTSITTLFGYLAAMYCHGMPLPCSPSGSPCITEDDFLQLAASISWFEGNQYAEAQLLRLLVGPLVADLFRIINATVAQQAAPAFALYSAHDGTLASLLVAFDVWNSTGALWPPYASHMVLEVIVDAKHHAFIRMTYNNAAVALPFCNNLSLCPVDMWWQFIGSTLSVNFLNDCGYPQPR